jgi:hypothetical protein
MTMSESQDWPAEEPEEAGKEKARDKRTGNSAAAARMQHQAKWVDLQIQQAMARGDFDDLPGYGKPIADLGSTHDPDWWLKRLVERERISVLPPSLQVRKDDLELDGLLDGLATPTMVRKEVEDFNERVAKARIQPLGGPPMITQMRDVDAEVEAWNERRDRRRAQRQAQRQLEREAEREAEPRRRRWWRR